MSPQCVLLPVMISEVSNSTEIICAERQLPLSDCVQHLTVIIDSVEATSSSVTPSLLPDVLPGLCAAFRVPLGDSPVIHGGVDSVRLRFVMNVLPPPPLSSLLTLPRRRVKKITFIDSHFSSK